MEKIYTYEDYGLIKLAELNNDEKEVAELKLCDDLIRERNRIADIVNEFNDKCESLINDKANLKYIKIESYEELKKLAFTLEREHIINLACKWLCENGNATSSYQLRSDGTAIPYNEFVEMFRDAMNQE